MVNTVKVSFGGYEVCSTGTDLRAMLVMDLVRRADAVLTSISSKGQSMVGKLSEPCRQSEANIAYLEANINHFRTILRCVTGYVSDPQLAAGSNPAMDGRAGVPEA